MQLLLACAAALVLADAVPPPCAVADSRQRPSARRSQFLLISYIVAAVIALTWPAPGKAVSGVQVSCRLQAALRRVPARRSALLAPPAGRSVPRCTPRRHPRRPPQFTVSGHRYAIIKTINIMIVFFISGLMLRTDDIKAAWRHKLGVLFGFVSTLAVTPCLGFAFREISLTPEARLLPACWQNAFGAGSVCLRLGWQRERIPHLGDPPQLPPLSLLPSPAPASSRPRSPGLHNGADPDHRGAADAGHRHQPGAPSRRARCAAGAGAAAPPARPAPLPARMRGSPPRPCAGAPDHAPPAFILPPRLQVRSMGGNEGLALLLTTGTNIVGIFTMPPWLQALFSGTGAPACRGSQPPWPLRARAAAGVPLWLAQLAPAGASRASSPPLPPSPPPKQASRCPSTWWPYWSTCSSPYWCPACWARCAAAWLPGWLPACLPAAAASATTAGAAGAAGVQGRLLLVPLVYLEQRG